MAHWPLVLLCEQSFFLLEMLSKCIDSGYRVGATPLTVFHRLLYPRHLCRGVYSFRLSVRPFILSFVRNFVPFVELLQSFTLKQLKWSISHQPLIRKQSYLDHRFPGQSAFIP